MRLPRTVAMWKKAASSGHTPAGIVPRRPVYASIIRFSDRLEPAVLADYVELGQGTGIVHTAPGHGVEDYQTGQKYGIETYAPIDDAGRFIEGLPEYKGKAVFEANPIIIQLLASNWERCSDRETNAQLPALLALPQSRDLPRHRAVVH